MEFLKAKLHLYFPLIKSTQTFLLMVTGLAGYMTARCPVTTFGTMVGLAASLFLSISGSTILNMWYDRDIDAKMGRTSKRPLASGQVDATEVLRVGLVISILGVGIAALMSPLYGLVIFAGLFFDVVVYTIWLKRKTAWAIVWGGISGAMPILAGRVLGLGAIDWIGLALTLALASVIRPSEQVNFGLFKYASLYMFGAMILLMF